MQLPKTYEPGKYESDMYALWEKSKIATPKDGKNSPTYTVVVPPPNANGDLHLGHGLTLAIQDIAIRFHRALGDRTLFIPGADHAGFETQVVFERKLAATGKSRFDFTREELYKNIWEFVNLNRDNLEGQYRSLGASVTWENYTFTLDDKVINRAYKTFKQMWDEGLIYRGERLVNFCTFHGTSFADIEVEHTDAITPLYYMQYGPFEIATTRPETKFGDTAVAVHPEDDRYSQYVGKVLTVEGLNGPFEIRVVADEMVDREFGTGVVKITPAHDFNDYEVAQRHNLPAIRVIDHDGKLNHKAGKYEGMTVLEARKAVVRDLDEKGLLVKTDKNYKNRVGSCYKCGTTIEPMLMKQWFVNMQPLAKRAILALEAGKITFYPDSKRDQLIAYLQNLRDWNISRQIIWGIPIPAFQNIDDPDDWIYDESVEHELIERDGKTYKHDRDVFDTWFSSGQWPFATLGYPDSDEYKDFYPLSLMETGADILMPWVSRMIMLGLYVTGDVPFKEVYLHGLVLDAKGQKFSKSKGNGINPQDVIKEYGSDALRLGLISGQTPGNNQPFVNDKVVSGRNFCNKLWNIARFIEDQVDDPAKLKEPHPETVADHWILYRLQHFTNEISCDLQQYRFSEAYEKLYHFVWDDFADWYIEASKATPNLPLLCAILEDILVLTHPFAPFVTETIWQALGWQKQLLAETSWPVARNYDSQMADEFNELQAIITEARFIVNAVKAKDVTLYHANELLIANNEALITRMGRVATVLPSDAGQGIRLTGTKSACWLDIDTATARSYVSELESKLKAQEVSVARLEGRLGNKSYMDNAPEQVVAQTKAQLVEAEALRQSIKSEITRFSS
jgi:valyl-tRNA synthetase